MSTEVTKFRVHQLSEPTTSKVTTARTASLDCRGASFATVIISASNELNTDATGYVVNMGSSDTTNFTATATATANRTVDTTTNHVEVYHIPITKRYLKVSLTPDTTTNGTVVLSATCLLSGLENKPTSTTGMVGTTNDAVVLVT